MKHLSKPAIKTRFLTWFLGSLMVLLASAATAQTTGLHIQGADGSAQILVEESGPEQTREMIEVQNNGTARISLFDTSPDGEEWQFAVNGAADAFVITNQGSGAAEFVLVRADTPDSRAGDLLIVGDLFTGAGSCSGGCDRLFEIGAEPIEQHAEYMWQNSHLPGVGPTGTDEPWNLTEKTSGILNELEKAHIYIEQLHERLKRLEERLDSDESASETEG